MKTIKQNMLYKIYLVAVSIMFYVYTADAQFTPIGPGDYSTDSYELLVDGTDVYADGLFINGQDMFSYGKFDGTDWNKLGNWAFVIGLKTSSIKVGNDIYLGGIFSNATGDPNMDNIARYNITTNTWYALGVGLNGGVQSVVQMGSNIIACGSFTDAGGDPNADYIAKWDGSSWSALATPAISPTLGTTFVNDMVVYNGELIFGGNFTNILMKWDGNSFTNVPGWNFNSYGAVRKLLVDGANNLYVYTDANVILKYDGNNWTSITFSGNVPPGNYRIVNDMVADGTDIYIGGSFLNAMGINDADYLIKFDGNSTWTAIGGGLNDNVNDLEIANGKLYIAGLFTDAGNNSAADKLITFDLSGSNSINEISNAVVSFSLYPNPNKGTFIIHSEKTAIFELTDITGKVIKTYHIQGTALQVNENLPAGMYFVRETESGIVQKLIIE
ncbi:MAG TPA: T9SS type A sorting domain-containing protein [Bacteroidia bacterium]|nr:T9SS type A sorting domain-containing protein [Bacteroidales bacterium]HRS59864.1 T9SS type A sorting domain-containing protein [Bacteroidia bacterium]